MDRKKHTLQDAQQEFIKRDLIPLFDEYKNNSEKLLAKTQEGYLVVTNLHRIKNGVFPDKFSKTNPYTIHNIKLWCKLNNKPFELLDNQKYKGTHQHLIFKCLNNKCGENFNISWSHIYSNQGCPYCSSHQVCLSNCLATKNPELAKEWHSTKNGDLTPYSVMSSSNKKAWWQCSNNLEHEWQATINSRNSGCGCPYCSGFYPTKENNLLINNPELCKEWDYSKNNKIPEEYCSGTPKSVWWKCFKGHEWKASISSRNTGVGCPYCAGHLPTDDYNLLVVNPKLCEDWDYTKNIKKPEDYTPGANQKVWWICKECGYEWESVISSRNIGIGCPKCNISKGEKQLDKILTQYNIPHDSQYTFDDLRGVGNGLLKFDVPVFWDDNKTQLRLLIEYDGEFHYKKIFKNDGYENLKIHDKLKNQYCKKHNIKLLRIPYWDFDNIEEIIKNELKL